MSIETRRYGSRSDAATIAYEVVLYGYSEGWCGDEWQRDEVSETLAPLRIRYVDDMRGRWEVRP